MNKLQIMHMYYVYDYYSIVLYDGWRFVHIMVEFSIICLRLSNENYTHYQNLCLNTKNFYTKRDTRKCFKNQFL